ncbi:mCG1041342, partial [Mus musculus]
VSVVCARVRVVRLTTCLWRSESKRVLLTLGILPCWRSGSLFCIPLLCTVFQVNWPLSFWKFCWLCLPSAGMKGMCHHARFMLPGFYVGAGIRTPILQSSGWMLSALSTDS